MRTTRKGFVPGNTGKGKKFQAPYPREEARKKLSDGFYAVRSAVDGIWRVWGKLMPSKAGIMTYAEQKALGSAAVPIWVCMGTGAKLRDAHMEARDARNATRGKPKKRKQQ